MLMCFGSDLWEGEIGVYVLFNVDYARKVFLCCRECEFRLYCFVSLCVIFSRFIVFLIVLVRFC